MKKFFVNTTVDRLNVFNSCIDVSGDCRHEVLNDFMEKYCLNVITSDVTRLNNTEVLTDKVTGFFNNTSVK
jgi:hypothetical protein